MKTLRAALATIVFAGFAPAPAPAAETQDGPKASFDDDFAAKLAGDWDISRTIRNTEEHNTLHAEWVLHHQFLELHMQDVRQPPGYEAIVLIGYVHSDHSYVAHWTDTFGGKFSAVGHGKRTGNSIEFRFDYDDGPFYNTFSWDEARGEWTFLMENSTKDGKRSFFARDTLHRR